MEEQLQTEKLADEIIQGRRLNRQDKEALEFLLQADSDELARGADRIRRQLCGDEANLCTIINGKSGRCSEDCKFCAQSSFYDTCAQSYAFLEPDVIQEDCRKRQQQKIHRYSIVTAGKRLSGTDFAYALEAYKGMKEACDMTQCASFGLLDMAQLKQLKEAGVSNYHANIETSRRNFPNICSTHSYDDKLAVINAAKEAGLKVCSGGIIGMGETWEDRLDMALSLAELEVESIPLNVLIPVKGTPFEQKQRLTEKEVQKTVAIFRYINPTAWIRMAGGRRMFENGGAAFFKAGANAAITGDMLTTTGNDTKQDQEMLEKAGFHTGADRSAKR